MNSIAFFKISKSLLRLTKECRSLSYDAMCAHIAIVMRYMFLAVCIRAEQVVRTAGPLFCLVADELADISYAEAMEKMQLFLANWWRDLLSQKRRFLPL